MNQMTASARPERSGPNLTISSDMMRIAVILLCVITLFSLSLNFASGIHSKTDEAVQFTGINFLQGTPEGKSNGSPHILLLGLVISFLLLLTFKVFKRDNTLMPIILGFISVVCILMFRFDVTYSAKAEFSLTVDKVTTVTFGIGWWLALCLSAAVLVVAIWDKSVTTYQKKKAATAAIYFNSTLPQGYHVKSIREIIAMDFSKHWMVYLLILPTLIFYIVWAYGPLYGIIIGFNDFTPKLGFLGSKWVGLRWFREFFRSPFAFRTIRNTLMINVWNLLIGFPTPIILALMLNEMRSIKYKRIVQTITYMPYFISLVVLCGILVDFSSTDGVFGAIAKMLGLNPINLLGDAKYFRTMYIGSEIWQRLGWDSIIFLSALSGIDQEQYEAATIDGAGKFKQVLHVTLPGIMPTIAILLILRVGSMMNVGFEKIILLYNGLTYETADVISSFVYRKGIVDADFSFSTAVNLFNSIINFLLVVFANKASAMLTETSLW